MTNHLTKLCLGILAGAVLLLSSCASQEAIDQQSLSQAYQTEKPAIDKAVAGDPNALHSLFLQSQAPGLDGETSEFYSAKLYVAWKKVGADTFISCLLQEKKSIRQAVTNRLLPILNYEDRQADHQKLSTAIGTSD